MKQFEESRDRNDSKRSSSPGEAPEASIVPKPGLDWTTQPIKVGHLADYARYRRKVGDGEAAKLIYSRISELGGETTFDEIAGGLDAKSQAIFKAAGAFILDLYRELLEA